MQTRLALASLVALAACGDSGAGAPDAAIDPPPVDMGTPHPIVGRWEKAPFAASDPRVIVEFEANGTYHDGSRVGTWSIEGDLLSTETLQSEREKGQFYLSSDHATLMTVAAFPMGPTDGLIGTWKGSFTYPDNFVMDNTFEFHADGTLAWTFTAQVGQVTHPADWTLTDDSIRIVGTGTGAGISVGMKLIPDVVIGDKLYTRLPQ